MNGIRSMLTALLKDIGDTAEEMLGFCKDENDCNRIITPLFEVQSELLENKYELIKNQGGNK